MKIKTFFTFLITLCLLTSTTKSQVPKKIQLSFQGGTPIVLAPNLVDKWGYNEKSFGFSAKYQYHKNYFFKFDYLYFKDRFDNERFYIENPSDVMMRPFSRPLKVHFYTGGFGNRLNIAEKFTIDVSGMIGVVQLKEGDFFHQVIQRDYGYATSVSIRPVYNFGWNTSIFFDASYLIGFTKKKWLRLVPIQTGLSYSFSLK